MSSFIKKIIKKIELRLYYRDSFNVSYAKQRGAFKSDYKEGEIITMYFGGAFNPMETWEFKYVGEYKGKKVFKDIHV